jgi:methionine synthase II (cobalamin-independent)
MSMLFPTTLVGSYPQPDWLIDRQRLAGRFPPRVRALELWRVPEPYLAEAQDDATIMAIKAQEDAGLDIISDGEIRRESYSNRFATALDGVDLDNPGTALDRSGEIRDLFNAGADVVQIDEPYMQARPEEARTYGLTALNRALENVVGTTAVHICFGYAAIIHVRPSGYSFLPELSECRCAQVSIETAQSGLDCAVLKTLPGKKIILGVIELASHTVESPELVAERIRRALPYVNPADLLIAPDCGMKYLPREVAFGKLKAMVAGAQIVRSQLQSGRESSPTGAIL